MLKISYVQIYGLEEALKYARYPMVPLDNPQMAMTGESKEKHYGRGKRLARTPIGTGHDNFLKGIVVQFSVNFTNKVWVQAERYHWFDIISSTSTVHALQKTDLDKVYSKYVDKEIIKRMNELKEIYLKDPTRYNLLKFLYSNPAGMHVEAGIVTNYRQLKTIYHQRRNHILPEWQEFCDWCETLPYFKEWCV